MDEPYTKREQDEWRRDVKDTLDRIETQTKKTNGRVSSLEDWKSWAIGALAVFVPIFIVVSGYLINQSLNTQQVVETAMTKVLQDYQAHLIK